MLGILFFVMGLLLLCDCPGVFVIAAFFSAVPACMGKSLTRLVGILFCIASIGMAIVQTAG